MQGSVLHRAKDGGISHTSATSMLLNGNGAGGCATNTPSTTTALIRTDSHNFPLSAEETVTFNFHYNNCLLPPYCLSYPIKE